MKDEVKFLIDHVFLEWSEYDPELAHESVANFIKDYKIDEKTTFEECKEKLLKFRHHMDMIRSMMA